MKKNNFKKVILLAFSTLALALGAGGAKKQAEVAVKADTPINIVTGTELYLKPNSQWKIGNAYFAVFFFNTEAGAEGDNQFVDMSVVTADTLYKVTTPASAKGYFTNVIFTRQNPDNATGWNTETETRCWNQTDDLEFYGTKTLYELPEGSWGKPDHPNQLTNAYWKVLPTVVTPVATTAGISSTRFRIWLDRNNHFPGHPYQYLLKVGSDRYSVTGYEKALVFDVDGIYFAYWDIEIATVKGKEVGFTIVNDANEIQVEIPASTFVEKDNSKLWRIQYDGDTATWSIQKDKVVGRVFASFVGKVLEGYLSCSASVDNGYGVFNLVNENFFERDGETWNVEGNLGEVTINDFENVADYATGTKNATVDAYSKHQMLQANYIAMGGGGPAPFALMGSTTNTLLISIFAISLIGICFVSFLALRKKREQN